MVNAYLIESRDCYELSWYRQFFCRISRTKLGGDADYFIPSPSQLIFLTAVPAQELASNNGTLHITVVRYEDPKVIRAVQLRFFWVLHFFGIRLDRKMGIKQY